MNENALAAAVAAFRVVFLVVFSIVYVFSAYINYRIGRKFGIGGFGHWCIPFYNVVLLCRCAGLSGWNSLWFLLPVANVVFAVFLWGTIAQRLGHSFWGYGLGIFAFGIPMIVLAFDSSRCVDGGVAETSGATALYCVSGEYAGNRLEIATEGIIIGRSPSRANLVLSSLEVSAAHVRVWADRSGAGVWVQDMGSENGTYYSQPNRYGLPPEWMELRAPQLLASGVHFRLGDSVAEFVVT